MGVVAGLAGAVQQGNSWLLCKPPKVVCTDRFWPSPLVTL